MKFSDYLIGNQGGQPMSSQVQTPIQPQQMQSIAPQQSMQSSVTDFGIKPNQSAPKKKVETFDVLGMLEKTNQFTQQAIKDNPAPVKLRTEEEGQALKNKIADYAVRLDKGVESIRDEYDIPKEDIIKIGDEYRQYLESKGVAIDENTTTHADLAYEAIKNGAVPGIENKERSAFGKLLQGGGNFLAGWTDLSGAGELGIKAGKLSAPVINTIRKALGKKELSEEDINNLAEKQRIEDESSSFSSMLGNKNTGAGTIGKGLKDIVATAGGGEALGVSKLASGVSKLAGGGIKGAIAGGATVGALETPIYTAVSEGRLPTVEEAGLGTVLGGGIPAVGGLLSAGVKKLPVMIGKSAEGLSVKGLLNANDAKKIVRTLKETGEGDVGSLGRWALERDIAGKTTEDALKIAGDIASKNYKGVRDAVTKVSDDLGQLGKDTDIIKAMTMVGKQADAINARAGYDAINKSEIDGLLTKAIDGTIDLNGKQRAKELIDEFINIYKKSGDVADTQIADVADSVRQSIRKSIEDAVDYATDGKINIREMNREVAVAKAFQSGIENKATANELRQFAIQSSYGAVAGTGGEFKPDSPERRGRVILGGIVGKQIGSMLGNPAIMGKIAKSLDKLSLGSRSNILKYMKYPTRTKLTQKSLEDLLSIKKSVISDPEITTAIKLLKEGQLESNPIRLTTPKKTRTLGQGATQQTKRPLSSNIKENVTNPINNPSSNTLGDNTPTTVKKKPVQSDTLVSKADEIGNNIDNIIKEYPSFTKNNEIIIANKVMSDLPTEDLKRFFNDKGITNREDLIKYMSNRNKSFRGGINKEKNIELSNYKKKLFNEKMEGILKKNGIIKEGENPLTKKTSISKDLQPLYEEARKYKSADEFVNENSIKHISQEQVLPKKQGDVQFYHGTDVLNYDKLSIPKFEGLTMDRNYGDYFYITPNRGLTETYGRYSAGFNIPKEKILSLDKLRAEYKKLGDNNIDFDKFTDEQFKKYWAIEMPDNEYIVKDVSKIRDYTKSQLTDIWNKAQKLKSNPLIQEAKKYKSADEFIDGLKKKYSTRIDDLTKKQKLYNPDDPVGYNIAKEEYFKANGITKSDINIIENSKVANIKGMEDDYIQYKKRGQDDFADQQRKNIERAKISNSIFNKYDKVLEKRDNYYKKNEKNIMMNANKWMNNEDANFVMMIKNKLPNISQLRKIREEANK